MAANNKNRALKGYADPEVSGRFYWKAWHFSSACKNGVKLVGRYCWEWTEHEREKGTRPLWLQWAVGGQRKNVDKVEKLGYVVRLLE